MSQRSSSPSRTASPPRWRTRSTWRWATAIGLLLLALLVGLRHPLAELIWPDTRIQQLLDRGHAALRAGHLSAADGSGARQYFEAAQALDNDRSQARDGLAQVGRAALAQARHAIARNDFAAAHAALALANDVQVPRAEALQVSEQLRQREAAATGIDTLLQHALTAWDTHHLDGGAEQALPLIQRVLSLQPNHTRALELREDILSDLLQQANAALSRGDLERGGQELEQVRRYDRGHMDLPATQARLAQAINRRLKRAETDLRQGRLTAAAEHYRAVQAVSEDPRARQGIERVVTALLASARRQAADYRFDAAETLLQQARQLAPQSASVRETSRTVAHLRNTHANLPAALPPREKQRQLQRLLADIAQAEERGHWMTPPGESAYDKLRTAQALAPDDAQVKHATARVLTAAQACFEQEWRDNRIRRAHNCLSAWQTLHPGDPALEPARERMAQKWLAVGEERLSAGDIGFASEALDQARAIDARAPGLTDFAQRVKTAQRTSP